MKTKKPKKSTVINKNDSLARELNIKVHGNRCERCGKDGRVYKMDWSHVFPREIKAIRWDMDNCMVHCFTCHKWWHDRPLETKDWFDEKYPGRRKRLQDKVNKAGLQTVDDYLKIQSTLKEALNEKL